MDSKGFFLGLIAAVVLFLLWKKEQSQPIIGAIAPSVPAPGPSPSGCVGCADTAIGGGANPPSYAAAPVVQSSGDGFVTPGTPPLAGSTGAGSFYDASGPTPDIGFLVRPAPITSPVSTMTAPKAYSNVAGSPTTPAGSVPARAIQVVPSYAQGGFQQRYNILGVPRAVARPLYLM